MSVIPVVYFIIIILVKSQGGKSVEIELIHDCMIFHPLCIDVTVYSILVCVCV